MPHLFKKSFVRPKSTPGSQANKISNFKTFKTPSLAKENIDKILQKNETTKPNPRAYYSQPGFKTFEKDQIIASSVPNLEPNKKLNLPNTTKLKRTSSNASSVSIHLSFEDASEKVIDDSDKSDISYRMNEPKIKDAYLQFVKKLSQSSSECKITSSPKSHENIVPTPPSQKSPEMFATPEELPLPLEQINNTEQSLIGNDSKNNKHLSLKENKKAPRKLKKPLSDQNNGNEPVPLKKAKKNNSETELNKKNGIKNISHKGKQSQKKAFSLDSGVSLSQEVLNRKDVKEAYLKFMKSSLESEEEIIKPRKTIRENKKINVITSSGEEFVNKSLEKAKGKATKDQNIRKRKTKETDDDEDYYENLPLQKRMALIQESRNVGLYALCDICNKARYLPKVKDPLDLPDKWYCAMHPDGKFNKCSYPEEMLDDEDYLIDNLYNAGSIVWAKMYGYPWWPAMVEDDVDTETYFWLDKSSIAPTWYHVTFFDSADVTRAWMRPSCLKPFKMNLHNPILQTPDKNKYRSRVSVAITQAVEAIHMPLIDRLKQFSFIYRYNKPLNTSRRNTSSFAEKNNVKEKRAHKLKKAKRALLVGHHINSTKNVGPSQMEISVEIEPVYEEIRGSANAHEFSITLNDIDWTDAQNLSFNLLD